MNECFASEQVLVFVVLTDSDVEVANNSLVLLELEMCPLSVIDELFQRLLQIVEHRFLGARNLHMVDVYLGIQFLRQYLGCPTKADEPARQ